MTEARYASRAGVTPFWNRFPAFFLYPLKLPAIIVLFVLAFLNGFLFDLFAAGMGGLIVGALLALVAALFSVKYGYDILQRTAHGDLDPPPMDRETLVEGYELPFKQIAVFFVFALVLLGLMFLWMPLVWVFMVLFIALLPAIVMTLALERSFTAAINPAHLGGMALRIGWPYFAVLGLVILLNGGAGTVMNWIGPTLPPPVLAFISAFVQNFFWFAIMHLMGYLLLQYHGRIGFQPGLLEEDDDGWAGLLDPVNEEIEAGNFDKAAEILGNLMRSNPEHGVALRQRRHQVLKLTGRENALVQNAGTLLAMLVDANRMREATDVYVDITNVDAGLRPSRESDYEPLMNMLVQRGEYRRAVQLASGFHKDFPDSDSIPPLYLEAARVLSDYLQQPEKARQITDFLIKRFPEHPVAPRARTLRDLLTN